MGAQCPSKVSRPHCHRNTRDCGLGTLDRPCTFLPYCDFPSCITLSKLPGVKGERKLLEHAKYPFNYAHTWRIQTIFAAANSLGNEPFWCNHYINTRRSMAGPFLGVTLDVLVWVTSNVTLLLIWKHGNANANSVMTTETNATAKCSWNRVYPVLMPKS